ncbi:MAG: NAD-binding oxidoreductase, partial [Boseongicola sp.]|nr:NAD-binding oxidoreductase [Boseongicola sp.]
MGSRIFSDKKRAVHLGPFPLERLDRGDMPDLAGISEDVAVTFAHDTPHSLVNAMSDYQAMMDAIRDGLVNKAQSEIPEDLSERSQHLKAFCYFNDASMAGVGTIPDLARRETPVRNPEIDRLAH